MWVLGWMLGKEVLMNITWFKSCCGRRNLLRLARLPWLESPFYNWVYDMYITFKTRYKMISTIMNLTVHGASFGTYECHGSKDKVSSHESTVNKCRVSVTIIDYHDKGCFPSES